MEDAVIFNVRTDEGYGFAWTPKSNKEIFFKASTVVGMNFRDIVPGVQAKISYHQLTLKGSTRTKWAATEITPLQKVSALVITGTAHIQHVAEKYAVIKAEGGMEKCYFVPGWASTDGQITKLGKRKLHFLALPKVNENKSYHMAFCVHHFSKNCPEHKKLTHDWVAHWYPDLASNWTIALKSTGTTQVKPSQPGPKTGQAVGMDNRFKALSVSSEDPSAASGQTEDVDPYFDSDLENDIEEGLLEEGIVYSKLQYGREGKIYCPGLRRAVQYRAKDFENLNFQDIALGEAVAVGIEPGTDRAEILEPKSRTSHHVTVGRATVSRVDTERGHIAITVEEPSTWKKKSLLAPKFAFEDPSQLNNSLMRKPVKFMALPNNPNPKYQGSPMAFKITIVK